MIDWSYDLLSDPERALLRRLSIFVGGWTLEAAEAVCSGVQAFRRSGVRDRQEQPDFDSAGPERLNAERLNTDEVLDLLSHLVEHSLVLHETPGAGNGAPRYRLLETIREYARERAEQAPELLREWADQHARYYLEFAEARVARMRTRGQVQALEELQPELDNLRVAIDGARARGKGELCARLALGLYYPLYGQGLWEEARTHLRAGMAALAEPGNDRPALRAALQYHQASLAEDRGDLDEARKHAETSLALRRELGDPSPIAETLNLLGKLAINDGDAPAARQFLGEALALLGDRDPVIKGKLMHNLGVLAAYQGDAAAALRWYHEGLAELRRADDPHDEARLLGDLGALAQQHDHDDAEARRLYLQALAAYRQLRDRHGVAIMLNNLGELAERAGQPETAVALFLHAEGIFRELHSAYITEPTAALARLARQMAPEQWTALRDAAERTTWDELLRPTGD